MRVVVVGASGFVGGQVTAALHNRGVEVVAARAPRLPEMSVAESAIFLRDAELDPELLDTWRGADALVNAAGNPNASARDIGALIAANSALPGLLGRYASELGVDRYVHVSSAVVQGRRLVLDETDEFDAFSDYARSKVLGEKLARRHGPAATVCYRPPSVHHESRRVTRMISQIASSPAATVAGPGDQPTPQALAGNVGAAVAELATCQAQPPTVVMHPWEQLTCTSLLELLGDRSPRVLPRRLAAVLVRSLALASAPVPAVRANARRVELIWFGQGQATSWLTTQGWTPPVGIEGWAELRERVLAVRDEQE